MAKALSFLTVGLGLLLVNFQCQAQQTTKAKAAPATVRTIEQSITKIGGKATVAKYLCPQDPATDDFRALNKVAAGSKEWVDLAVKMLPYSDAGCSESLHSSLGEAMQKQPLNVLPYVGKSESLSAQKICLPFISVDIPDAEALRVVRRSKSALMSVKDKGFSKQCQQCLAQVAAMEKSIAANMTKKK